MTAGLRTVLAANPSPMTLDGTRTHIVGAAECAVIDPGPELPEHLDRVAEAVRDAVRITIVITHYHPDHAGGAALLGRRLRARVRGNVGPDRLAEGDVVPSDAGDLHVLETPGHAREHIALHWPAAGAIFCGDLMMGGLDTALVAAPQGDLTAYIASLERLRALRADFIYPTHGPEFPDPERAIGRYLEHREERMRAVVAAVQEGARGIDEIAARLYGEVDPGLREWVGATTQAYLEHLERTGRIDGTWRDRTQP
jgi:glyoxylase-like metal-dependent hydrolase (beta-lactamase superfamily II)